jgi:hypothetical protein
MPKTWFVSYRRRERPARSGHARKTETFESEAEAKSFARTLSAKDSDITTGSINPHMPKKLYGSGQIDGWLAEEATG